MPITSEGRWYNASTPDPAKSLNSQTVGATGGGGAGQTFNAEDAVALEATINITAISGAGASLQLVLESTLDGTNWYTVDTFPAAPLTATGSYGQVVGGAKLGTQARWRWTVAGTSPSITFSLSVAKRRRGGG